MDWLCAAVHTHTISSNMTSQAKHCMCYLMGIVAGPKLLQEALKKEVS